ncbi:MAG: hypothetical protein RJQ08_12075 [Salinisphaeraceae bacterium]
MTTTSLNARVFDAWLAMLATLVQFGLLLAHGPSVGLEWLLTPAIALLVFCALIGANITWTPLVRRYLQVLIQRLAKRLCWR